MDDEAGSGLPSQSWELIMLLLPEASGLLDKKGVRRDI